MPGPVDASVGTPFMWLDAADKASLTVADGLVSQWNDKSGNNNHVTAAGTARPTTGAREKNGRNVLDFNGSTNTMVTGALSNAQPYTFAAVCVNDNGADSLSIGAITSVTNGYGFGKLDTNVYYGYSGGVVSSTTAVDTNWHIFIYAGKAPSTAVINIDGTETTGNAGAGSYSGGMRVASTTWNGAFAEVVTWNGELVAADRTKLLRYFRTKWFYTSRVTTQTPRGMFHPIIVRPVLWIPVTPSYVGGPVTLTATASTSSGATATSSITKRYIAKVPISSSAKAPIKLAKILTGKGATSTSGKAVVKLSKRYTTTLPSSTSAKAPVRIGKTCIAKVPTSSSAKATTTLAHLLVAKAPTSTGTTAALTIGTPIPPVLFAANIPTTTFLTGTTYQTITLTVLAPIAAGTTAQLSSTADVIPPPPTPPTSQPGSGNRESRLQLLLREDEELLCLI